jgi:hypothetical protein
MPASKVHDKNGQEIHEGDYVFTRIRGGSHQGKVRFYLARTASLGKASRPAVVVTCHSPGFLISSAAFKPVKFVVITDGP